MDSRTDYGQTPLHMAVGRGNTKSVEKLVMYGASVNAVDQDGCTPLYYLTSRGEGMEPPNEDSPMTYKVRHSSLFSRNFCVLDKMRPRPQRQVVNPLVEEGCW